MKQLLKRKYNNSLFNTEDPTKVLETNLKHSEELQDDSLEVLESKLNYAKELQKESLLTAKFYPSCYRMTIFIPTMVLHVMINVMFIFYFFIPSTVIFIIVNIIANIFINKEKKKLLQKNEKINKIVTYYEQQVNELKQNKYNIDCPDFQFLDQDTKDLFFQIESIQDCDTMSSSAPSNNKVTVLTRKPKYH